MSTKEKYTTIGIHSSTKALIVSLMMGKESYEDTIVRTLSAIGQTTTIAVDKAVVEDLKSLNLYSSEPLQGVIVRAIQALKSGKQ